MSQDIGTSVSQEQALTNYFDALLFDDRKPVEIATKTESRRVSDSEVRQAKRVAPVSRVAVESQYIRLFPLNVVGLRLAIPADKVSGVIPFPEDLRFDCEGGESTRWTQSMEYEGGTISVINTAALIVPMRHPRYQILVERAAYSRIVLIGSGKWGIAADEVDEEVILAADNVSWRDGSTDHAWLAGTIKDFGYAVIDTVGLARLARRSPLS